MSNTHGFPDTLLEIQAIDYDLLPSCLLSASGLTVPGSGLTLAAVAAIGYVRRGAALLYVNQSARAVTMSSTTGNHWLALTADTHTAMAGWTRIAGSHYVEQANATQPAAPDGALLVAQVVVTGANITAVTQVVSPALSRQNANNVEITGGSVVLTGVLSVANTFQADPVSLHVSVPSRLLVGGNYLGINTRQQLIWDKTSQHGILLYTGSDAGSFATLNFLNASGVQVGSITQTGSGVAYNTTSDRRLKTALAPLTGALATILALQPRAFRWRLDDTPGVGLVADEVQALVPEAVSGTPDGAQFQGIDYSKLVPHLIAACQELAQHVQRLTARLAQLEGAV